MQQDQQLDPDLAPVLDPQDLAAQEDQHQLAVILEEMATLRNLCLSQTQVSALSLTPCKCQHQTAALLVVVLLVAEVVLLEVVLLEVVLLEVVADLPTAATPP